jgi:hydrogenase maturation protease
VAGVRTVLVFGYGNPGRQDDGLGPAVVEALEKTGLEGVTLDANYQLSVEDAALVAEHDVVVFVDADAAGPAPFWFGAIEPADDVMSFSTHSVRPEAVLALARGALGGTTAGYVLGVRGYAFDEFGEALTEGARRNLEAALAFLGTALAEQRFEEYVRNHRHEAVRGMVAAASAGEEGAI